MQHYVFSRRSEENLDGVHPDLTNVMRRAIELSEIDFMITEGMRTMQRQEALLRDGKSKTLRSRHLTGHAVDVAACVDEKVSWDWQHYDVIARAVKQAGAELGIPVEWGGDWKSFKDGPHFQLPWALYPEDGGSNA